VQHSQLVLVHSPLVGVLTWQAVHQVLTQRGRESVLPSLAEPMSAPKGPYLPAIAATVAAAISPGVDSVVLVGHSGAGPILPVIATALGARVSAAVYVDALLPEIGKTWFDRAPRQAVTRLRELRQGALLPPWTTWFSEQEITDILPDPELRDRFTRDLRPLPVAFFEEVVHGPELVVPSAYLMLSDFYADSAARAAQLRWPVIRLRSHHLAMLTDPEAVTAALLSAVDAVVSGSDGCHHSASRSNTRCQ